MSNKTTAIAPDLDCRLCPRLVEFRENNQEKFPDFFNAPVPSFGSIDASLLIVGLAPGLKGANWSGRPFTGDYAGDLLYPTLLKYGLATGSYGARADDDLHLTNARITNAVRCVPPANKPTGPEAATCLPFLNNEIKAMKKLQILVALGTLAHNAVIKCLGEKQSAYKFGHMAEHNLGNGLTMMDSYHCSRYNTNTGRLTEPMFHAVFESVTAKLES